MGGTQGSADAAQDAGPSQRADGSAQTDAGLREEAGAEAGAAPPFNDTQAQLDTFWSTYGGRDEFPSSYVDGVETLLWAEDELERGDYAAARTRIERIFADAPLTTNVWWAGAGKDGTNVGSPVAYYGLRMLDEITQQAESASSITAKPLRMTVVMPRCAEGMRPTSADLSTGESVSLTLDPAIEAEDHRVVRQALRLFQHYVWAITGGALELEPSFVHVNECVSVVYRANPSYAGIADAQAAIDQVSDEVKLATDMWWVLYPSNVPSAPQFDAMAFITGGMGGRGRAPVFIIDDLWLLRKPAHLGKGPYTDVERRVYLPQWLQHEFFHHLFRTWPELELEKTGHQWFDRQTWPVDFVGDWEPDYYAEALHKRLYAAEPSIASALRIALPPFDARVLTPQDFVGSYERQPVENGWHSVTISLESGQLMWRNAADLTWALSWADGKLRSSASSPYGERLIEVVPQRDAEGSPLPAVQSLVMNGESYRRTGGL